MKNQRNDTSSGRRRQDERGRNESTAAVVSDAPDPEHEDQEGNVESTPTTTSNTASDTRSTTAAPSAGQSRGGGEIESGVSSASKEEDSSAVLPTSPSPEPTRTNGTSTPPSWLNVTVRNKTLRPVKIVVMGDHHSQKFIEEIFYKIQNWSGKAVHSRTLHPDSKFRTFPMTIHTDEFQIAFDWWDMHLWTQACDDWWEKHLSTEACDRREYNYYNDTKFLEGSDAVLMICDADKLSKDQQDDNFRQWHQQIIDICPRSNVDDSTIIAMCSIYERPDNKRTNRSKEIGVRCNLFSEDWMAYNTMVAPIQFIVNELHRMGKSVVDVDFDIDDFLSSNDENITSHQDTCDDCAELRSKFKLRNSELKLQNTRLLLLRGKHNLLLSKQSKHAELQSQHDLLLSKHAELQSQHDLLLSKHAELQSQHDSAQSPSTHETAHRTPANGELANFSMRGEVCDGEHSDDDDDLAEGLTSFFIMQNNPYNHIGGDTGRTLADAIQKEMVTVEELVDLGSEEEKRLLLHSPSSTSSERFRKNSDGRLEMLVWSNTEAAHRLTNTNRGLFDLWFLRRVPTAPKEVAVFDQLKDLTLNKIERIPVTIKYLTKLESLKVCESDSVYLAPEAVHFDAGETQKHVRDVFHGIQLLNTLEISLCRSGNVLQDFIYLPYITSLKVDNHPGGIIRDISTMFRNYTEIDTKNRPALFFTLKTFVLKNSNYHLADPNVTEHDVIQLVTVLMQMFPNMQRIDLSECPAAAGTFSFGDRLFKCVRQMATWEDGEEDAGVYECAHDNAAEDAEDNDEYDEEEAETEAEDDGYYGCTKEEDCDHGESEKDIVNEQRLRDGEFPRDQLPLWPHGIRRILQFREQLTLWQNAIRRIPSFPASASFAQQSQASALQLTLPPNSIWDHTFVYEIIRKDLQANKNWRRAVKLPSEETEECDSSSSSSSLSEEEIDEDEDDVGCYNFSPFNNNNLTSDENEDDDDPAEDEPDDDNYEPADHAYSYRRQRGTDQSLSSRRRPTTSTTRIFEQVVSSRRRILPNLDTASSGRRPTTLSTNNPARSIYLTPCRATGNDEGSFEEDDDDEEEDINRNAAEDDGRNAAEDDGESEEADDTEIHRNANEPDVEEEDDEAEIVLDTAQQNNSHGYRNAANKEDVVCPVEEDNNDTNENIDGDSEEVPPSTPTDEENSFYRDASILAHGRRKKWWISNFFGSSLSSDEEEEQKKEGAEEKDDDSASNQSANKYEDDGLECRDSFPAVENDPLEWHGDADHANDADNEHKDEKEEQEEEPENHNDSSRVTSPNRQASPIHRVANGLSHRLRNVVTSPFSPLRRISQDILPTTGSSLRRNSPGKHQPTSSRGRRNSPGKHQPTSSRGRQNDELDGTNGVGYNDDNTDVDADHNLADHDEVSFVHTDGIGAGVSREDEAVDQVQDDLSAISFPSTFSLQPRVQLPDKTWRYIEGLKNSCIGLQKKDGKWKDELKEGFVRLQGKGISKGDIISQIVDSNGAGSFRAFVEIPEEIEEYDKIQKNRTVFKSKEDGIGKTTFWDSARTKIKENMMNLEDLEDGTMLPPAIAKTSVSAKNAKAALETLAKNHSSIVASDYAEFVTKGENALKGWWTKDEGKRIKKEFMRRVHKKPVDSFVSILYEHRQEWVGVYDPSAPPSEG